MEHELIIFAVIALIAIFGADFLRSFGTSLFWLILAGGAIVGLALIFDEVFQ